MGYAQLAMNLTEQALPLFNHLKAICKAVERSADLTRQLLTFARKQTIAPKILDLNETLDSILKMVRRLIGEDITDVIMPGINGRKLAEKIISLYPEVRCLFMSGYTDDVIAHHGVLDEGGNFIQKPFSMQTFAAKVREVLDKN